MKADIGEIIRKPCKQKDVEKVEAQACKDQIHMLVEIPPSLACRFLKRKECANDI